MNISHIVTNGCSFTYCQGLPTELSWPALLAERFDIPLVNLGLPGLGNDSIYRRTCEYLYANSSYNSKPLVVIGWSQPWRREIWLQFKDQPFYPYPEYYAMSLPDNSGDIINSYSQHIVDHWSDEDHYRRSLMSKLSLINLLETMSIPYVMTNFMNQRDDEKICNEVDAKFPEIANKVNNSRYYLEDVCSLARDLPNLECGHHGPEKNVFISEFLEREIRRLHPNLSFVKNQNFYKLHDFAKVSKLHIKFPKWIDF